MSDLKTPESESYSPEQEMADYRFMAGEMIAIGDQIIEENRLAKIAEGANLFWYLHGKNSAPAQYLEETARDGMVKDRKRFGTGMGIHMNFNSLQEHNLPYGRGQFEGIHHLVIDFAKRLGFFDDPMVRKEIEMYGVNAKTYAHPTKPFAIRLIQDGLLENNHSRLAAFEITHS